MTKTHDDAPINLDDMQPMIAEAIADTEREIFGEATGGTGEPLDESGDRSLEQMGEGLAGEHEPDEGDADGSKEQAEIEAQATREADKGGHPPKEDQLRAKDGTFEAKPPAAKELTVAEQIAAALAEERKAADARYAALEAKLAPIQIQPKSEHSAPPKSDAPDMFLDPVGYQNWMNSQMEARETRIRAESSLRFAALAHGETFQKAYAEFGKLNPHDPQQLQIGRAIATAGDPGEAMVTWYRQQEALRRVAGDPDAYEARVREEARQALAKDPEFRKQLLSELQADAARGDHGQPRVVTRLPSLNGASGSSSARLADPELYNNTDRSVFNFATGRQ